MKTSVKLVLGFTLAAVLITYVSAWIMELNKYNSRLIPPEELEKNLEHVKLRVESALPLPWTYGSKDEFDRAYSEAKAKIKEKMLPIEAFKILQPVLSTLNDQNVRLQPPVEPVYRVLPFMVSVVDGRMIVTSTADTSVPLGSEILSISGISKEQVIQSLLPLTSGEHEVFREQQLTTLVWLFPEIFKLRRHPKVDVLRLPETHRVVFTHNGEKREVEVKTTTAFSYSKYVKSAVQTRGPYEFERRGEIGILKLGTFALRGGMYNRYREFLNGLFLEHADMKTLLIDLRGCATHDHLVFQELCEHLITESTRATLKVNVVLTAYNLGALEKVGVDFQSSTGEVLERQLPFEYRPRDPIFRGRVVILVDRYTTNAAFDFLLVFSKIRRGIILGERPATRTNHTLDVTTQFLSGVRSTISYPSFRLDESDETLELEIQRELTTDERIEFVLGKSDVLLEETLEHLRKQDP